MNIHFLNWNKEDFLELGHIYKYVDFDKFKTMIGNNAIVMGSPQKWIDPFEQKMLTRKYSFNDRDKIEYPFKSKLMAYCFTNPINCEAQWNAYQHSSTMVQVCFNTSKLLKSIYQINTKSDLYIGLVRYFKTSEIDKEAAMILDDKIIPVCDEDWLRLMLLKRIAYSYEKEIRFLMINDDKEDVKLEFDDIKTLIERVTIEPDKSRITCENQQKTEDYIKSLGLEVSLSHLYYKAKNYPTLNINKNNK